MSVTDASIWVSLLYRKDPNHTLSAHWLRQQQDLPAPAFLLPEVAGAIARRTNRPDLGHRAVATLMNLPALRILPVDADLITVAAQLAADLRLRGADAVYVALARRLSLPLVTWDDEQLTKAQTVISTARPTLSE